MMQAESFFKVLPKRLNPEPLGGVMACGKVVNTQFPGQMNRLFRNLTADKGIHTGRCRLFQIALGCTGAPSDTTNLPLPPAGYVHGLSPQGIGYAWRGPQA